MGSEQINMRSKDIFPQSRIKEKLKSFKVKGNFHDMEGKLNIFYNEDVKPIEQRIEDKETDCVNDPVKLQVMRIHNEDRVF